MKLTDLAQDILLEIAQNLSVQDVLMLKQTCHCLNTFGSDGYLWRQLISNLDIPIDIIPGASLSTYSSEELQKISVKAVRLDRNWLRTPPRVYHILDLDIRDDHFTSGIQGVSWVSSSISSGGRWLLVTSLSAILMGLHLEMRMSLWYLGDIDNPLCVLNIARTSGAVNGQHIVPRETGRRSATFCFSSAAVGSLHQVVEIHSVSLADAGRDFTTTDSKFVVKPHPRAPSARLSIIEISASDNDEILISTAYTGAGVVSDDQGINPGRRQIFFVNKRSGRVHWVDSRWVECCMRIWSRLYDGFLILIAEVDGVVVLRIYEIPSGIFSQSKGSGDEDHNPSDMVELGPVVAEYQFHPNFSKGQCIRGVSQVVSSHMSIRLVFKSRPTGPLRSRLLRCSLNMLRRHTSISVEEVDMKACISARGRLAPNMQMGARGHRAVFAELDLSCKKIRLMKVGFAPEKTPMVIKEEMLIHNNDESQRFAGLVFDETSGRLCIVIREHMIRILDFV